MSTRRLQIALVVTALAAGVVMSGLLGTAGGTVFLAVVLAGAWYVEPERSRQGGGWWWLLAAGGLAAIAGFAVHELSDTADTLAGVITIAGTALVIAGATIGFPTG